MKYYNTLSLIPHFRDEKPAVKPTEESKSGSGHGETTESTLINKLVAEGHNLEYCERLKREQDAVDAIIHAREREILSAIALQ